MSTNGEQISRPSRFYRCIPWLVAALVSVGFTAFHEWPELTHTYYVDDDIRPAFLVWRYRDATLFPNDPSSVLYRPFGPRGFLWFYGAIATKFDWLAASKYVPFFTMGLSALLVFALARRRDAATGWIVLASFLLLCRTNQFYTSSWRCVANVLVCGFVLTAVTRKWVCCCRFSRWACSFTPCCWRRSRPPVSCFWRRSG